MPASETCLYTISQGGSMLGHLAVDTLVAGRCCGGLRLLPDVGAAELQSLARAMTLKYGFLGLPQGGAKAGVLGDPEAPEPERRQRLLAFAQALGPLLRGRYTPGPDMGTSPEDICALLAAVGRPAPRPRSQMRDSGLYTAWTVLQAALVSSAARGFSLAGCPVAIEGFGKVGQALARLLVAHGARLVAVSTSEGAVVSERGFDPRRLRDLAARLGSGFVAALPDARRIPRAQLIELPVRILFPCARHDSVHAGNAGAVQAELICPGANNPVTASARTLLEARGVLCFPDFIANCGGVLGGTMAFASVPDPAIESFIAAQIQPRMAQILGRARRRGCSPTEIAETWALDGFAHVRRRATRPGRLEQLVRIGLVAYRRGWLPGALVGRQALPYFKRLLLPYPD